MKQGVTVITPTGDRPEAFALCWKYMMLQTVKPDEWIVMDDGTTPCKALPYHLACKSFVKIHRTKKPNEPAHTLPCQLLEALPFISYDMVLIMEDDDWYSPNYIERMTKLQFSNTELWGQGQAVYYHLNGGYYEHGNTDRASLCQTGFKHFLIPLVEVVCKDCVRLDSPFVDESLWRVAYVTHQVQTELFFEPPLCVGIKGMPGRKSTRMGLEWGKYTPDPKHHKLRSLIGDDYKNYYPEIRE